MKKSLLIYLLLFFPMLCFAQQKITGRVVDKNDNQPLIGATIQLSGSTGGTITDYDGYYSLEVNELSGELIISFIGYESQKIAITGNVINVSLSADAVGLEEVVITALGIEKDKKALGYSVQEISSEQMGVAKDVNLINQISGKVAGLTISNTNGGVGSSTRIILRGNRSLAGENQALIVVDGVPVENQTVNTAGEWGGTDYGSGISDLNPDDIESISILKGANAAALYGSRAGNGVILITTKKGATNRGLGVSVSTNTMVDVPYILWDLQNEYGAGRNGKFDAPWALNENNIPVYNTGSGSAFGSWGPKMTGQTVIDWDGVERTFLPQANNYRDFYQLGYTSINSVSLETGSDKSTLRFTFSNLMNEDITPGTDLMRNNFSLRTTYKVTEKFNVDLSATYVQQKANNRLGLSNSSGAPRHFIMMPRNISSESLESSMMNGEGEEQMWYRAWNWISNPYFTRKYSTNEDSKDRVMANLSFQYAITDYFSVMARTSVDFHYLNASNRTGYNSLANSFGSYGTNYQHYFQQNSDFLLIFNKPLSSDFKLNITAGGSNTNTKYVTSSISTSGGLVIPYFYNLQNSREPVAHTNHESEYTINALYFNTEVDFKSYLFLNITGRQDWASTLSADNNAFFYPSVSASFVFTEAFGVNDNVLSFGKIRTSWAKVGDASPEPYLNSKTYYLANEQFNGTPHGYLQNYIPLIDIKPEMTTSIEAGADLRFFMNRIGLDVSYYSTDSKNQILSTNISGASGAAMAVVNSGQIHNEGFEALLNVSPIKIPNSFSWDLTFNFAKNKSEVIELVEGTDKYILLSQWRLQVEARPGHPYGDIVGYGIKRNENGEKLVDANGMYIRTDEPVVLGNALPDWTGGVVNTFTYKNIALSCAIDVRIGGELFAGTNMYAYGYSGNFTQTLAGREEWYASEAEREAQGISPEAWTPTGGILADAVFEDGTANNRYVNPEVYWEQFSSWTQEIHEPFIYDASYVKLRELFLSYNFKLKGEKIKGLTVSLIGRNLWIIHKNVPNIDPESYYTNGNGQGVELYSYPSRRSFGVNLKLTI